MTSLIIWIFNTTTNDALEPPFENSPALNLPQFHRYQLYYWLLFFTGITGLSIQIDKNGDAEGNFSLLALADKKVRFYNSTFPKAMSPVGIFVSHGPHVLPVSEVAM